MYRLYNLHDTGRHHQASTLDELFNVSLIDPDLIGPCVRNIAANKYLNWLQATISDDNWLDYLAIKVMNNNYLANVDEARGHWQYKTTVLAMADHPKWVFDFINVVSRGTRQFTIECNMPRITGEFDFMDAPIFNTNSSIKEFTEGGSAVWEFIRQYVLVLTDRYSSSQSIRIDQATALHSPFFRTMFFFVNDDSIIHYIRRHDTPTKITASLARRILSDEDPDQERSKCGVEHNAEQFRIVMRQAKRPATREQLGTVLNYSTNVLEYLPFNIRSKTEAKTPLYGVELETATHYHPREVIAAQQELFFICKSDGSISGHGSHKFEMVTVPATFKAHRRLWADWFNKLDYNKFDTSKNTTNGMHVHIDRKAFTKEHLNKFTWFFINPANYDFLYEISERPNKNDFMRWAPTPYSHGFHSSNSKLHSLKHAIDINGGLRGAINYKRDVTVEVRIFKGVVSYATILKNLEFVDSLYYFTLETPALHNTLTNYLAWLDAQPSNRYKLLREFISQLKNLPQLKVSNTVKDYLYGCTTPEAIIDKLKKAPFPVTNQHLTVLNRERRKRTFILNKDGTLSLAYTSGGKLASLDKEMQAKITRGTSSFTINAV
jgi:hypothetical protein